MDVCVHVMLEMYVTFAGMDALLSSHTIPQSPAAEEMNGKEEATNAFSIQNPKRQRGLRVIDLNEIASSVVWGCDLGANELAIIYKRGSRGVCCSIFFLLCVCACVCVSLSLLFGVGITDWVLCVGRIFGTSFSLGWHGGQVISLLLQFVGLIDAGVAGSLF